MSPSKRKIIDADSSFEDESPKHRRSSLKVNLSYVSTPSPPPKNDSSNISVSPTSSKDNNETVVGKARSTVSPRAKTGRRKKGVHAKDINDEEKALGENCELLKRAILSKTREIFNRSNEIAMRTHNALGTKKRAPERIENLSLRKCPATPKVKHLLGGRREAARTRNDSTENFERFDKTIGRELPDDTIVGTPRIASRSLKRDAAKRASPRKRLFVDRTDSIAKNSTEAEAFKENGFVKSPIITGNFQRHNLSRISRGFSAKFNENFDALRSPVLSGRKQNINLSRLSLKSRFYNTEDNETSLRSKGQARHRLDASRLSSDSATDGSVSPGPPLTCSSFIDERKNGTRREMFDNNCEKVGKSKVEEPPAIGLRKDFASPSAAFGKTIGNHGATSSSVSMEITEVQGIVPSENLNAPRSRTLLRSERSSSRTKLSMGVDRQNVNIVRSSLDNIPLRGNTLSPERSDDSSANEDEGGTNTGKFRHVSVGKMKVQGVMAPDDDLVTFQKTVTTENIEECTERSRVSRYPKVSNASNDLSRKEESRASRSGTHLNSSRLGLRKKLNMDVDRQSVNTVRSSLAVNTSLDAIPPEIMTGNGSSSSPEKSNDSSTTEEEDINNTSKVLHASNPTEITKIQGVMTSNDDLVPFQQMATAENIEEYTGRRVNRYPKVSNASNDLSRKKDSRASGSGTHLNSSRLGLRRKLNMDVDRQSVNTVRSSLAVNTSLDAIPPEIMTGNGSSSSPEKSNDSSTTEEEDINNTSKVLHASNPTEITKIQGVMTSNDDLVPFQQMAAAENTELYTGRTRVSRDPKASNASNDLSRKEDSRASGSGTHLNLSRLGLRRKLNMDVDRQSVNTVRSSLAVNTSLDAIPQEIMTEDDSSSSPEKSNNSSTTEDADVNNTSKVLQASAPMELTKVQGVRANNDDLVPSQEIENPENIEKYPVNNGPKVSSVPGGMLASALNVGSKCNSLNTVKTSLNLNTSVDSRSSQLDGKSVHENKRNNDGQISIPVNEKKVNTSLDSIRRVATVLLRDIKYFGLEEEFGGRNEKLRTSTWELSSSRTRMDVEDTVFIRESMSDSIDEISLLERIRCRNDVSIAKHNFNVPDDESARCIGRRSKGFGEQTDGDGPSYIEGTPYPMSRSQLMKSQLRSYTITSYSDLQKRQNQPKGSNDPVSEERESSSDESYHTIEDRLNILYPVTSKETSVGNKEIQAAASSVNQNVLSDNNEESGNRTRESAENEKILRKGKKRLLPLHETSAIVTFTPVQSEPLDPKRAVPRRKHKRAERNKKKVKGQDKVLPKKQGLRKSIAMSRFDNEPIDPEMQKTKQKKLRRIVCKEIIVKKTGETNMPRELQEYRRVLSNNADNDDDDDDDRPAAMSRRRSMDDFQNEKKSVKTFRQIKKSKIVIVTTGLSKEDKSLVKTVAKTLGSAKIEQNVTSKTTHVVSAGLRTINLLRAIIRGCWLVSLDWVLKSLECGKWENPENYEMAHFSKAVQESRRDRQLFGTAYIPELFATCGFIYIENSTTPPAPILKELVKTAGGQITAKLEEARVVIGQEGLKELWILDSITTGDLQPMKQYLQQ